MVSRSQKRVWRYVEEGSLLKLKSYLRKHPELELNFSQGKRQRGPLHLACAGGEDAILRLLVERGADVLQKDRKGDTALHVAANRALKHGKRAYDDLVVPLRKSCPEAMLVQNNTGVTPQDLLQWMRKEEPAASSSRQPEPDPEKEWLDKLFGEYDNEFCDTFGQYDGDVFLPVDEDEEDFMDWADRIREEYYHKRHAEAQRLAASCSGWKRRKEKEKDAEKEERSRRELNERLQREHEEYLARAARKEEETRQGKKKRYEEKCAATFHSQPAAASTKLSYSDIPWPAPKGSAEEMAEVMLHGADRKDVPAFRKLLRRQQVLWHPDKFAQRCGARLEDKDKQRILETVKALSQELNRQVQSLS